MARLALSLLFVCCLWHAVGCGQNGLPTARVSGKVTYKGEPLKGGMITFFQAARPYLAEIGADGRYSLLAGVGPCQVTVEYRERGRPDDKATTPGIVLPGKSLIPEKYSDSHKSGLSFEVKPGSNEANFDL